MDRRLAINVASMAVFQASAYLVPLINYPLLTRVLHVHGYGVFGLSFTIATYPVLLTDWGFALSAPGEVARRRDDPQALSEFFWNTIAAKSVIAMLCLAVLALVIAVTPSLRPIAPVLFAANLTVLTNVLTVNWCLQGLERLESFAAAAMLGRLSTIPATYLLVHGPDDVWIAAAVQVGGALIGAIASIVLLNRLKVIRRAKVSPPALLQHIVAGRHLFLAAASGNFYTTLNTLVLGLLSNPTSVGYYFAADRLRAASQGVIQPISQTAYPRSSRLMMESQERGMDFARKVLLAQGVLTLIVSATMIALAPLIISILAGAKYGPSVAVLRILALAPLMVGLSDVLGIQLMLPLGLRPSYARIRLIGSAVNLVVVVPATLMLGVTGTAFGTVSAEFYILCAMAVAVRRRGFTLFPKRVAAA